MVVLLVILAIAVLVGLYLVFQYNGLVRLRNRIESAWAQIDVQLQRRYDLVAAGAFRFTEREYYEADDASRPPVKVQF